jgi:hypothetical protein
VPSLISFRPKPSGFILRLCLNLLKVILPVPEVIILSLSGKIFESRERFYCGIRWLDRSEEQSRENLVYSISNYNPDKRRLKVFIPLRSLSGRVGHHPGRVPWPMHCRRTKSHNYRAVRSVPVDDGSRAAAAMTEADPPSEFVPTAPRRAIERRRMASIIGQGRRRRLRPIGLRQQQTDTE